MKARVIAGQLFKGEKMPLNVQNIEIEGGNARITWLYPEISDRAKQNWLEIQLSHTRAADSIRIKYDSERDGWSIEQASIFEWEADDKVCDQDWQEVAFIQAWAREKNEK